MSKKKYVFHSKCFSTLHPTEYFTVISAYNIEFATAMAKKMCAENEQVLISIKEKL